MSRYALLLSSLSLSLAACGSLPATHYYRVLPEQDRLIAAPVAGSLAIGPFEADAAYSDERILYRTGPYRLDYYNYHRWTSPPSVQVSDGLRDAYVDTGLFRRVQSGATGASDAVLTGRVSMFDEVDESDSRWVGRIELELQLEDARAPALWWSQTYRDSEPLAKQSPEGLARALSVALRRIVATSAPEVAGAMQVRGSGAEPTATQLGSAELER